MIGEISWRHGAFAYDGALGDNQSDGAGLGRIR